MIDVNEICQLHRDMVVRWHRQDMDNPYREFLEVVCAQHSYNYLLWHEEDIARSPDVGDIRVAQVKRAIDRYNQLRNDWIEKIDDSIVGQLLERRVSPALDAPLNTETPGSTVDRLSIIALRIYHLEEQTQRTDATAEHVESVERKLAVCLEQQADLSSSLAQLLNDLTAGRRRHKTYRALKMYNDPALNPYLYQAKKRLAG